MEVKMGTDHRTWGQTQNCKGCRFWSEMLAKSDGGPVFAMCLNSKSSEYQNYKAGFGRCDEWKSGHLGAVDSPGESEVIIKAYAEES